MYFVIIDMNLYYLCLYLIFDGNELISVISASKVKLGAENPSSMLNSKLSKLKAASNRKRNPRSSLFIYLTV